MKYWQLGPLIRAVLAVLAYAYNITAHFGVEYRVISRTTVAAWLDILN